MDSLKMCGVVLDRESGIHLHVDIVITDPFVIEVIKDGTLKQLALDVDKEDGV
jgi:hypothetical protein